MSDILLHLLPQIVASLLYAALGLHFWHTRWREIGKPVDLLPMQPWERMAIGVALVFQGIGLYEGLFSAGGMRFSFSLALSLMFWMAVLIYWLESFRSRMDGLQPMVLPLAAFCSALPVVFPQIHVISHANVSGIWPIVCSHSRLFMPFSWGLLNGNSTMGNSTGNSPAFLLF